MKLSVPLIRHRTLISLPCAPRFRGHQGNAKPVQTFSLVQILKNSRTNNMILISVDLIILHLLETHMVLVTRFCIGCIGYVYVCHKGNCLTISG